MDTNNWGEWKRPLRLDKRIVVHVSFLQIFDAWNAEPTKACVGYECYWNDNMASKPTRINKRKNGTHYVDFEGFRYDIDISAGNTYQWVDWLEDEARRANSVEKALKRSR